MIYKALKTGSITDKEGKVHRFWAGQTLEVKKSDFDIDFDKHEGFERADKQDEKKGSE